MRTKPKGIAAGLTARCRLVGAACGGILTAQAALYTFSGNPSQNIPDANPSGIAYTFEVPGAGRQVSSVSVTLNISGGWNGDLYAYLAHDSSVLLLLDRVGVAAGNPYGYGDAGFGATLRDSASVNIHNYGGNGGDPITGTFRADGQTTSPMAAPSSFSAGGGGATFTSTFGGTDPYGLWRLFLADVSGGSTATLDYWSVEILAVPEPLGGSLGAAGMLVGVAAGLRFRRRSAIAGERSGCRQSEERRR
jgi:subtilisin-like proprotein convertase family protein